MFNGKRILSPRKENNVHEQAKKPKLNKIVLDSPSKRQAPQADCSKENLDFVFSEENDFDIDEAINNITWQRCVVQEVSRAPKTNELILQIRPESQLSDEEHTTKACHLRGPWSYMRVQVGDLLSLQAKWQNDENIYTVDLDQGYCVNNPDLLISGTTVTGSLFCSRKAVLQERFRGLDKGNSAMVVGSLVHEVFQIALTKKLHSKPAIENIVDSMFMSPKIMMMLYEKKIKLLDAKEELLNYVPHIVNFLKQYVTRTESSKLPADLYQGCITEIQDIEENVWVPQLGLKGKIDVSVRVHDKVNGQRNVPLELKTGRPSFSPEHKGQLFLYQLMQTTLGHDTNSGLLLYLRDNLMREIQSSRNVQRDLIMLRNQLAYYLAREVQLPPADESAEADAHNQGKLPQPLELPEPIHHHSACGNCAYATVCCSFAKTDAQLELSDAHPLQSVMAKTQQHLAQKDYEYFMHWCGLLALEEQEVRKSLNLRALWTDSPETRQKHGRAICNLLLLPTVTPLANGTRYQHSLKLSANAEQAKDLRMSGFDLGEYVIISSTKRLAVAAGCITELTAETISLELERNLGQKYAEHVFIVDKHESQSFSIFNYTNLGLLLEDNPRAASLRSIIIHNEPVSQKHVMPSLIKSKGMDILNTLNEVQRKVIPFALSTSNFCLIKGLPGTGKTQTLVTLIRLMQLLNLSVLITSQTHSAVDNLLLRLLPYKFSMLRLGSSARIHPQLLEISEEHLTRDCSTQKQLAEKLEKPTIVGVTCLGSSHALLQRREFDFCIVDEATQVMQPTVLRPLFHSKHFILVGDPEQLPPLVKSREARQRGADVSLFQRLDDEKTTNVLTQQYRMNRTINRLANKLTYQGTLCCGSNRTETAALQLPSLPAKLPKWLQRVLHSNLDQAVLVLDTQDCSERSLAYATKAVGEREGHDKIVDALEEQQNGMNEQCKAQASRPRGKRIFKYTNYCEVAVVFRIIRTILETGYEPASIGVIAPYRAQVDLLRKLADQNRLAAFKKIEVNTVDQYQGRDKDIIIYSCTKTGNNNNNSAFSDPSAEILEDHRRLTVAITRAKLKLVVVGDVQCLDRFSPFKKLFKSISSLCHLKLADNSLDFDWSALLDELSNQTISNAD